MWASSPVTGCLLIFVDFCQFCQWLICLVRRFETRVMSDFSLFFLPQSPVDCLLAECFIFILLFLFPIYLFCFQILFCSNLSSFLDHNNSMKVVFFFCLTYFFVLINNFQWFSIDWEKVQIPLSDTQYPVRWRLNFSFSCFLPLCCKISSSPY